MSEKAITEIKNSKNGLISDYSQQKRELINWKINKKEIFRLKHRKVERMENIEHICYMKHGGKFQHM